MGSSLAPTTTPCQLSTWRTRSNYANEQSAVSLDRFYDVYVTAIDDKQDEEETTSEKIGKGRVIQRPVAPRVGMTANKASPQ